MSVLVNESLSITAGYYGRPIKCRDRNGNKICDVKESPNGGSDALPQEDDYDEDKNGGSDALPQEDDYDEDTKKPSRRYTTVLTDSVL